MNNEAVPVPELYYSVHALKALGQQITGAAKVVKNLQAALKKDDSLIK